MKKIRASPVVSGAHAGLGGAFMIATADGKPDVMHAEGWCEYQL